MELLKEFLLVALYAVITTAVPILVKGAWEWVKSVKEESINQVKNERIKSALHELSVASDNAVLTTFQTYVDTLKKNGEFTKEAHAEALAMAKDTLLKSISIEAKEVLNSSYENLDSLLTSFLESSVCINKSTTSNNDVAKPQ